MFKNLVLICGLSILNSAYADVPLQLGSYEISKDCSVSVGEIPPGSGRYNIRVDQKTPPMFASYTLETKSDQIPSGPDTCDHTGKATTLKGQQYSRYWSQCGGPFSALDGKGGFIIDRATGKLAAASISFKVARWGLPPGILWGLNSGPIKVVTDEFSCAQEGFHSDEAATTQSIDQLDHLNHASPTSTVSTIDADASLKQIAASTGRAPADEPKKSESITPAK